MIIFEGMPGAGKTTRLSFLLEAAPDRVVIFPEAQPPGHISHDHDAARWLLTEDLARATGAGQINRRAPESVIISDRSYLGVLAYRRALAACGLAPSSMLKSALAIAQELDIIGAHRSDTFVLISLTVEESLRRRSAFAADKRHRLWFDSAFLTAYTTRSMTLQPPTLQATSSSASGGKTLPRSSPCSPKTCTAHWQRPRPGLRRWICFLAPAIVKCPCPTSSRPGARPPNCSQGRYTGKWGPGRQHA